MTRLVQALLGDEELAREADIPLAMLRAIRAVESNGNPRAVRFEPHVFHRLSAHRVPYTPGPRGPSLVRAETNRAAFEHAFELDPSNAIRATSWGLFQVLGGHLLDLGGGNPMRALILFDASPLETSHRLLVRWFRARPSAREAARALDFDALARAYNGSPRYAVPLRDAYDRARALESGALPSGGLALVLAVVLGGGFL